MARFNADKPPRILGIRVKNLMKEAFPFYDRVLFRLLLPVLVVGVAMPFILVTFMSVPLKSFLTRQFDANLQLASVMGFRTCQESFSYLLDLRLESNSEMNRTLKNETLRKIASIGDQFPHINLIILKSGRTVMTSSLEDPYEKWDGPSLAGMDGKSLTFDYQGHAVRAHVHFFPFWDWHIVSFVQERIYQRPVNLVFKTTYLCSVGVFLSVLGTILVTFYLLINKPLKKLTEAANGVARGNLDKVDQVKGKEFGLLRSSFNSMIDNLEREKSEVRSLIHQLQESEALFRSQFEFGNIGIAVTATEEDLTRINARFCQMLGYTEEELQRLSWQEITHPEDLPRDMTRFKQMLAGEIENYEIDKRIFHKNGKTVYCNVCVSCFRNPDRSVRFIIVSASDITDRILATEKLRQSNEIINRSPVVAFLWKNEPGWPVEYVSENVRELVGHSAKDFVSGEQAYTEIIHPDDLDRVTEEINRFSQDPGTKDFMHAPYRLVCNDGQIKWVHDSSRIRRREDGSISHYEGIVYDITDRKLVEEELERSANFTMALLDAIPTPVFYKNRKGLYQGCNRAFTDFMGLTSDEIRGKGVHELWPGDLSEKYHRMDLELIKNPKHQVYEFEVKDKNGEVKQVIFAKNVFLDESGKVAGIIGAFSDISELKAAEKAQSEANRMLRLVLDSIPTKVFWKDRDSIYLGANQAFAEDAGVPSPEALIGKNDFELAFAPQAEGYHRDDNTVITTGEPKLFYEERQDRPDGKSNWVLTSKVPIHDEQQQIIGVLGTYLDITERKAAEREIRNLRNYLSNIIDSMPSVIVGVDKELKITQWNQKAQDLTGIPLKEAVGRPLDQVFPDLDTEKKRIAEAIRSRGIQSSTIRSRRLGNQTLFEDVTIYPLVASGVEGAVIRIDDVTEKVRLEEMMVQSEKMLSVGGLAAGMAHEINNPLAGMMHTAETMKRRLKDNLDIPANREAAKAAGTTLTAIDHFLRARGIHRMIDAINASGRRVKDIVGNMLSFARKSEAVTSSHAIGELIDKTLELAATDYDLKRKYDFKRILIDKDYGADVPTIPCEGAKIQQVLLNVFGNGAQAMQEAETKSPQFTVRTRFDKTRQMVRVEIEDNGPGMDERTRKRVFEPFFTTKPVGTGTGLGLSVSYFIITQNHGGTMEVRSRPGNGTTFVIQLPVKRN